MLLARASVEICCGCRPCCCRCCGRSCQWNKIFQEDITERLHVATECLMQHFSRYICIAGAGQGGEKCLLKRFLRSFGPVSRNLPLSGFQRRENLPPLTLSGIISLNETKWSENDIETRIYVWCIINIVNRFNSFLLLRVLNGLYTIFSSGSESDKSSFNHSKIFRMFKTQNRKYIDQKTHLKFLWKCQKDILDTRWD